MIIGIEFLPEGGFSLDEKSGLAGLGHNKHDFIGLSSSKKGANGNHE